MQAGADVDEEDNNGVTALRYAVAHGNADVAEFLRAHGAAEVDGGRLSMSPPRARRSPRRSRTRRRGAPARRREAPSALGRIPYLVHPFTRPPSKHGFQGRSRYHLRQLRHRGFGVERREDELVLRAVFRHPVSRKKKGGGHATSVAMVAAMASRPGGCVACEMLRIVNFLLRDTPQLKRDGCGPAPCDLTRRAAQSGATIRLDRVVAVAKATRRATSRTNMLALDVVWQRAESSRALRPN